LELTRFSPDVSLCFQGDDVGESWLWFIVYAAQPEVFGVARADIEAVQPQLWK
jgi:hypothetical protein